MTLWSENAAAGPTQPAHNNDYYCNLSLTLINHSEMGKKPSFTEVLFPGRGPRLLDRNCNQGEKGEEAASEETPPNKRVSGSSRLALSDYDDVGTRAVDD